MDMTDSRQDEIDSLPPRMFTLGEERQTVNDKTQGTGKYVKADEVKTLAMSRYGK